jgi:CHASE2 domain-containing sensor protein
MYRSKREHRHKLFSRAWWRADFLPDFRFNIILGLAVTLIVHYVMTYIHSDRLSWIVAATTSLQKWQMNALTGFERGDDIAFIDIDEAAYEQWKYAEPFMTDRAILLGLIQYARKNAPRLIFVDIDLASASSRDPKKDKALGDYLRHYRGSCAKSESICPPIILPKLFRPVEADNGQFINRPIPSLNKYLPFQDSLTWDANKPILWGSVDFDWEADQTVSRWRLWEDACDGTREIRYPSAVYEATLLGTMHVTEEINEDFRARVHSHVSCKDPSDKTVGTSDEKEEPDVVPTSTPITSKFAEALTTDSGLRRIMYRIPAHDSNFDPPEAGLARVFKVSTLLACPQHQRPDTAPAVSSLVRCLQRQPPNPLLNGEIVVIGTSFEDGGDANHPTPIGPMPGAMILINELNSFMNNDYMKEVSLAQLMLVESVLIFFISFFFSLNRPFLGLILSLSLIVLSVLSVGLFAFKFGYWFDSIVPTLSVFVHEFVHFVRSKTKSRRLHRGKHANAP